MDAGLIEPGLAFAGTGGSWFGASLDLLYPSDIPCRGILELFPWKIMTLQQNLIISQFMIMIF